VSSCRTRTRHINVQRGTAPGRRLIHSECAVTVTKRLQLQLAGRMAAAASTNHTIPIRTAVTDQRHRHLWSSCTQPPLHLLAAAAAVSLKSQSSIVMTMHVIGARSQHINAPSPFAAKVTIVQASVSELCTMRQLRLRRWFLTLNSPLSKATRPTSARSGHLKM